MLQIVKLAVSIRMCSYNTCRYLHGRPHTDLHAMESPLFRSKQHHVDNKQVVYRGRQRHEPNKQWSLESKQCCVLSDGHPQNIPD